MSITTIADPTVRLVASKKLCKFVGSLKASQEMPKNISDIFSSHTGRACSKVLAEEASDGVQNIKYTEEEEKFLAELEVDKATEAEFKELISPEDSDDEKSEESPAKKSSNKKPKKTFLITLRDVKWLDGVLKEQRSSGETDLYLHELLESCDLVLPENEVLERNPELEARCEKLRRQQQEYEYHKMTRNVDNSLKDSPEDTISFQSEFPHLRPQNDKLQTISKQLSPFSFVSPLPWFSLQ